MPNQQNPKDHFFNFLVLALPIVAGALIGYIQIVHLSDFSDLALYSSRQRSQLAALFSTGAPLSIPDRTWVPFEAPLGTQGPSPRYEGMKAGGVSLDTKRQLILQLGGDVRSNALYGGVNASQLFEGVVLDSPPRIAWRLLKPDCPDPTKDTIYPRRPDRPFFAYDSLRDRHMEWIGFGDPTPYYNCPTWTLVKRIGGHSIFNPRTGLWEEGDWPPMPYEYLHGTIPTGGVYFDNEIGGYRKNSDNSSLGKAYGGDSNMEFGGVYDETSDTAYFLFNEGGWGNNLGILHVGEGRWERVKLSGESGELRGPTFHRSQIALVPGEALYWYARVKKGIIRFDIPTRKARIVATMPAEAYQPVDTSQNLVYQDASAFDPVNRAVMAIPFYTFNGDFPGMLIVKVARHDAVHQTEWIPVRAPTVDDFKGVTRVPWGNRLVYIPWAHAFYILGGHNVGPSTRPARDPDPTLNTTELTRWHWFWRLGGTPPPPPPPPSDTIAPSVPTGLFATAISSSQINLSWTASTDNIRVVGYKIYRGSTQIATVFSGTTYQNTGLSPATTYSYTVSAYDAAGNTSAQSASASATTQAPSSDTIPPATSLTSPLSGATVSGTITVSANASDNIGVLGVQFKLDGSNLGTEVTEGSQGVGGGTTYSLSWNTTQTLNGSHTLTAVARDAAGNTGISPAITVTVSNIAPPPLPPSGPVGYWKFDEGLGTTAGDSSGLGNNGTLVNGPVWTTGRVLGALNFDGVDDYVNLQSPTSLDNMRTLTYSAWIYPRSFGGAQFGRIVDKFQASGAAGATGGPALFLCGSSVGACISGDSIINSFKFWQGFSSAIGTWAAPTNSIVLNKWTHVAVTYNNPSGGTTANPQIYINGVAVTTTESSAPSGTISNDSTLVETIGGRSTDALRGFDGLIDEVRIYNRALSSTEVQSLLLITPPPPPPPPPPSDITPPTASITSPLVGATVSGTISVTANASDNVGVVGVQFKLDGVNLGVEDTVSPYSVSWNTTQSSNASHTLTAVARDQTGNTGTSPAITVTVSNVAPPPPPPPPVPQNAFLGQYYDNMDLTNLKVTRTDATINFNWGSGSPSPLIGADTFSVRWEGDWNFATTGIYRFTAQTDDGLRIWINGVSLLDKWINQPPTTYAIDRSLIQGNHRIKVEYFENGGGATARLNWSLITPQPTAGSGTTPNVSVGATLSSRLQAIQTEINSIAQIIDNFNLEPPDSTGATLFSRLQAIQSEINKIAEIIKNLNL